LANAEIVDDLVQKMNDLGLVAFVDWKSDRSDLNRSKTNQFTAEVLQLRMRQSKCLFLLRSNESDSSRWVSWELGYFSTLDRKVVVLNVLEYLYPEPEYIAGLPKARLIDNRLQVADGNNIYDFCCWLRR
jgi:chromosome condensin MukBEF MukE localization factor